MGPATRQAPPPGPAKYFTLLTVLDGRSTFDAQKAWGALFRSETPADAGQILKLTLGVSDFSDAFSVVIATGRTPCTVPYSSQRARNLNMVVRPGDVWVAVVYPTADHHPPRRRPQTDSVLPPPTVYYGTAPLTSGYRHLPAADVVWRTEVFHAAVELEGLF